MAETIDCFTDIVRDLGRLRVEPITLEPERDDRIVVRPRNALVQTIPMSQFR
jgi:hypothetical protein